MTVQTRAPSRFMLEQLTPVTMPGTETLPVPVRPPLGVDEVKRELAATARELRLQSFELPAVASHCWYGKKDGALQRARAWIERSRSDSLGSFGLMCVLGLLAGGTAAIIANELGASHALVQYSAWVTCGLSVAFVPLARLTVEVGRWRERVARGRMVELADLNGPLERFRLAEGPAKARALPGLEHMRDTLHREQALSPEALRALNAAISDGAAAREAFGDSTLRSAWVHELIEAKISDASVREATTVLAHFDKADRPAVAQAILDIVFSDRRRVAAAPYEPRIKLHAYLAEQALPKPAAKEPAEAA